MIDYHQLKQIHEWAQKLADKDQREVDVLVRFEIGKKPQISLHCYQGIYYGAEIVAKIIELTRPKAKYRVGQEVWFLWGENQIIQGVIDNLIGTDAYGQYTYLIDSFHLKEQHLHLSKESLIEAQLSYWHKQNCEDGRHEDCEGDNECIWCGVDLDEMDDGEIQSDHGIISSSLLLKNFPFQGETKGFKEAESIVKKHMQDKCSHEVNKETKSCRKCGLDSKSIPCVGGWI